MYRPFWFYNKRLKTHIHSSVLLDYVKNMNVNVKNIFLLFYLLLDIADAAGKASHCFTLNQQICILSLP